MSPLLGNNRFSCERFQSGRWDMPKDRFVAKLNAPKVTALLAESGSFRHVGSNPWRRDLGWRERLSAISATVRLHPVQFRLTDRNRHGLDRAAAIESQLQNLANGTEADLVS